MALLILMSQIMVACNFPISKLLTEMISWTCSCFLFGFEHEFDSRKEKDNQAHKVKL